MMHLQSGSSQVERHLQLLADAKAHWQGPRWQTTHWQTANWQTHWLPFQVEIQGVAAKVRPAKVKVSLQLKMHLLVELQGTAGYCPLPKKQRGQPSKAVHL